MTQARTAREKWVQVGLEALGEGGPDQVRIEELARRLGVTKGGFYGYFSGREQLMITMLDAWEREAAEAVIVEADAEGGTDAAERLRAVTRRVQARARMKPTELSIREWARHDSDVAARVHRVDRARMAYMHELFLAVTGDEQEAAALAAVSVGVWLASHLMRFEVSGYGHDDVLRLAFERTTLADSPAKTLTMGTTHAPA